MAEIMPDLLNGLSNLLRMGYIRLIEMQFAGIYGQALDELIRAIGAASKYNANRPMIQQLLHGGCADPSIRP